MAANASELFRDMDNAIRTHMFVRESHDPTSPAQGAMVEALPSSTFVLEWPLYNLPDCKSVDLKWATAYTLHFFAETERAGCFRRYNKRAEEFLTGDRWIGAYGVIGMPGIRRCLSQLSLCRTSRRALTSMGGLEDAQDKNRPCCWSSLHFLSGQHGTLDMLVYQRSLNLHGVMVYDLVALTNIHNYVAVLLGMDLGSMRWTVGSLHCRADAAMSTNVGRMRTAGLVIAPEVLHDTAKCRSWLDEPEAAEEPYKSYLLTGVRT